MNLNQMGSAGLDQFQQQISSAARDEHGHDYLGSSPAAQAGLISTVANV